MLEHATFGKFSAEATDAAVKDLVEGELDMMRGVTPRQYD